MRMIGTVPGEAEAERFTAYLLTLKIDAYSEKSETSGEWLVWVEHDDLIDRGREELALFKAAPDDPKYAVESQAGRIRREKEAAAQRRQKNYTDVRTSWSGVQRFSTPVTVAMVGLCGILFLLAQGRTPLAGRLYDAMLFEPARMNVSEDVDPEDTAALMAALGTPRGVIVSATDGLRSGQLWRIWSPMFMHGNFMHILFNMMWLLSMGGRLEARKGPWVMLTVVLVGGLLAHVGQAAWMVQRLHGEFGPITGPAVDMIGLRFVGMSGVNYAIFGFLWIYGRLRPNDGLTLRPQDIGLALGWLVLCMTPLIPNVANAAHVMGLVAGVAMAWVYVRRTRRA